MSSDFETTNLGWELQQLQQQVGEGLERFLVRDTQQHSPSGQIPAWLQQGVFWLIVVGTTVWTSWQLYRVLSTAIATSALRRRASPADRASNQPAADWVARAHRAQRQGDQRQVCRLLYMAALEHLHHHDLVRQEPSRTDGEYLRLVQALPTASAYHTLFRAHEQICFSQEQISPELCDRCWQAYRELTTEHP